MIEFLTTDGQLHPMGELPALVVYRGQVYEIRATDRGRLVMFRVQREVPRESVPRATTADPARLALAALHPRLPEEKS